MPQKRRFFHTYKTYPTTHNLERLNNIANLSKRLIRRDYKKFIDSHICQNLNEGNSKPLFHLISKSLKGENCSKITQLYNCKNNDEMAMSFAMSFKSVFTMDDGYTPPVLNHAPDTVTPSQANIDICEQGVLAILRSLNHRKGTGPDNLGPALLKFMAEYIAPILTLIFRHSINTGCVPKDWKCATVVPVHKKGDRQAPLNYRPISLTSVSSKLLEHIIAHEIRQFLDTHDILSECQHGFRQKHSCESQLIHTVSDLTGFHNNSTQVDVLVLDFSKAFDTVSHQKLIHKLKSYGLNPNLVAWIQDWLSCRTFSVLVNGCLSPPTRVTSGVPQGSVLGPLLFLLYINDLPEVLNCPETSIRLFADDAILYRPITNVSDCLALQDQLTRVTVWAGTWQLQFNVNKCTSTSMCPTNTDFTYSHGAAPLRATDSFIYLGVCVCSSLSFNNHINNTIRKANSTLFMLMRALKGASSLAKRTAYFSVCLPLMEYASEIWNPDLGYLIQDIEKVNRKAFRWAHCYSKYDNISSEMIRRDWHPLESRREMKDLRTLHKIKTQELKVSFSRFTRSNEHYNTRGNNIRHTINSSAMKNSFFNRVLKF